MSSSAASMRTLHWVLGLSNFAVGVGAFTPIGLLSPMANALGISPADAGWMMTIYAIVYAISSPVLVALSGRVDRARVLLTGLVLLSLGSFCAAAAPGFGAVLAGRAVMAVGAGLVTPVTAAVGIATSTPANRGAVLSLVLGGLSLAQVGGIPTGAWLAYAVSWRVAFVLVGVSALASAAVLYRTVPRGLAVQPTSLAALGEVLRTPRSMLAVGFTALFMSGVFAFFTYLSPFLEQRYGLSRDGVTGMLLVYGVGAVIGNSLGGRLLDRIGAGRTLIGLCVAQALLMSVMSLALVPLWTVALLIVTWSICGWSFNVPQQARLGMVDPARASVLLSLNAAAMYVGSSVGASLGGWVYDTGGLPALGPSGAVLVMAALASLFVVRRMVAPARA